MIQSVLERVGIERVITVDDDYNRGLQQIDAGTLYTVIAALPPAQISALLHPHEDIYSPDERVFNSLFHDFWDVASDEEKTALHENVKRLKPDSDVEAVETNLASIEHLPMLFGSLPVEKYNLHEWRGRADEVYSSSATTRTMILFDQDFKGNGGSSTEGTNLVRTTINHQNGSHILCCLVSHHFHEERLQEEWKAVCKESGFHPSQVIIIPKELVLTNPKAFASLVKLSAVAPHYDRMREEVLRITLQGVENARDIVSELGLADLDRMVFRASDSEGVWEPDTLIRIFGIVLRSSTKEAALESQVLREASAYIRSVSGVATPALDEAKGAVWKFNRSENYEEGPQLNKLHRPTDLGDVYEKSNGKCYVLIAPPCDLMVRTERGFRGRDADSVKEVTLAELTDLEPPPGLGWKMDFFLQDKVTYVHFKKTVVTRLSCLDLCVYNEAGEATFSLDDKPSPLLIPAWEKRHALSKKELEKLLALYARINPEPRQKDDVSRLIARADGGGVFAGNLSPESRSLTLNLKRIGRLLAPRSTALVRAYAEFLHRDAFDHSFGAEKPQAATAGEFRGDEVTASNA